MLNKVKHKTRCKCIKREEGKSRSSHRDNTNVLSKEFEVFTVKRFGKQVSLLIIGVNKLKSESTIFDKLPNKVMSNLYVFGSRMLNRILRNVNGTSIVIVDSEMLLSNTIIMEKFLHPQELVQQLPVTMYSASAMDNEMEFCFLLIQETRLFPT